MKNINLWYWIVTGLFAAFMILSSTSNVTLDEQAVQFLNGKLGYPVYIIPFLGVAKILGSITLLIPGFQRVKEWAYAGLCFDLVGATYSFVALDGLKPDVLPMFLFIGFLFLSYYLWHKKQAQAV